MKIVYVFKDFYPPLAAGITCYLADISDAMAHRGHQVEVHVAGVKRSRRDRLPSGVVVHRHREIARALSMPLAPGLVREVRTLDADLLHVHLPNPIGEIGVVLNHGPVVVATFHAQLGKQRMLEPLYGPLRNALLNRAAAVLVSGDTMATVPELVGCSEKVRVLPFGVSPRRVGPEPRRTARSRRAASAALRRSAGLLQGDRCPAPGARPRGGDATLSLVGDGANRAELEALASQLGVAHRAQFLGSVPDSDLAACYSAMDVFVLPSVSRAEAFGMAMTEAMANGVPAISTALGTGTDWVNLDGQTGLVVPPNDVGALAAAIGILRNRELFAYGWALRHHNAPLRCSHSTSTSPNSRRSTRGRGLSTLILGTGFVGSVLAEWLRSRGIEVTQSSRTGGKGDVTVSDGAALDALVVSGDFDQIVALGQLTGPDIDWVLERVDGPRWLIMSSQQVISAVPAPGTTMALAREELVLARGGCVLRPTMIFGSGGDVNVTRLIATMQRWRVPIVPGSGSQMVQPLHVDDLSGLVTRCIICDHQGGLYAVGGAEGRAASRRLVATLAELLEDSACRWLSSRSEQSIWQPDSRLFSGSGPISSSVSRSQGSPTTALWSRRSTGAQSCSVSGLNKQSLPSSDTRADAGGIDLDQHRGGTCSPRGYPRDTGSPVRGARVEHLQAGDVHRRSASWCPGGGTMSHARLSDEVLSERRPAARHQHREVSLEVREEVNGAA